MKKKIILRAAAILLILFGLVMVLNTVFKYTDSQIAGRYVTYFNLPEDTYKVSFLALPAGFTYMDEAVQEFYFENGSTDLTITLKAAE